MTSYSSTLIFSIGFKSIFGSSVTEIIYSRSLSSPKVLRSIFGCPAGFILLSLKALVVVSFKTLSKTSPNIAFPNCLFNTSLGTFPGLKPLSCTVLETSSYLSFR